MKTHNASAVQAFVALGFLVCTATMFAQRPTLADLGKQEEDRRKAVATPAKVLTNTDLRPVVVLGAAPPAASPDASATDAAPDKPQAAEAEKVAGKEQPKDKTQDESYWRDRIGSARSKLGHDKTNVDGLQSQINFLNGQVLGTDDLGRKQQLNEQRGRVQHELDLLRKEIQNDTKAVADIPEEARRAGVPPGWLR